VRIGELDGDLFDPRLAWTQYRGIGRNGAVLVRPDRFVGWRSLGRVGSPARELASALQKILGKTVAVE
jgi:2,4-dichlorophenol 6-monooxygenase